MAGDECPQVLFEPMHTIQEGILPLLIRLILWALREFCKAHFADKALAARKLCGRLALYASQYYGKDGQTCSHRYTTNMYISSAMVGCFSTMMKSKRLTPPSMVKAHEWTSLLLLMPFLLHKLLDTEIKAHNAKTGANDAAQLDDPCSAMIPVALQMTNWYSKVRNVVNYERDILAISLEGRMVVGSMVRVFPFKCGTGAAEHLVASTIKTHLCHAHVPSAIMEMGSVAVGNMQLGEAQHKDKAKASAQNTNKQANRAVSIMKAADRKRAARNMAMAFQGAILL